MWNDIARSARACGSSPMYTWVSSVGRIELSGTTFLNGVSKAANMMRDGLDAEAGDDVFIDLGNHWQSPVWIGAALSVQAVITSQPENVLAVVSRDSVNDAQGSRQIVVISRDPFGMPEKNLDAAVINGSLEVRGFGDVFSPMGRFQDNDPVLRNAQGVRCLSELRETAASLIESHNIVTGSRIAIAGITDLLDRAMWHVVIPVIAQCSVVLLDGIEDHAKTCEVEQVDRLVVID